MDSADLQPFLTSKKKCMPGTGMSGVFFWGTGTPPKTNILNSQNGGLEDDIFLSIG